MDVAESHPKLYISRDEALDEALTIKYVKSETFETRIRYRVNDKGLKSRLAISHRKVGKLFDGLLASFGGESELLERDFTNRLQEIEKNRTGKGGASEHS